MLKTAKISVLKHVIYLQLLGEGGGGGGGGGGGAQTLNSIFGKQVDKAGADPGLGEGVH